MYIYIYIFAPKKTIRHHLPVAIIDFRGGLFFFPSRVGFHLPPEEKKMRLLELDRELMQVGRFVSLGSHVFYPFFWGLSGDLFLRFEIKPELAEG